MKVWSFIVIGVLLIVPLIIFQGCGGSSDPGATPMLTATSTVTPTPTLTATSTVTPSPTPQIACIYDTDSTAPDSFKTLLDANGYSTTMIAKSDILTTNFSSYALIIIADETTPSNWNPSLATAVDNSGKPIIAVGGTGSYFYNYIPNYSTVVPGLSSCGTYYNKTDVTPVNAANPIWSTPYLVASNTDPLTIYNSSQTVCAITKTGWPGSDTTNGVSIAAITSGFTWHFLARESSRYFLWGYYGPPSAMNATGQQLFVNAVYYMLHY